MSHSHATRPAASDEIVAEMDRRGIVIESLEARIAALEAALRPSAYTKARYIGEVKFYFETGSEGLQVTVPWTATKEIMAMILAYANRKPGAAP